MKTSITIASILGTLFVFTCFNGCAPQDTATPARVAPPYVKVFISKAGDITLDGQATSLDEVRRSFASLKQENGVVLYARESKKEFEPHPNAMRVIELVTQNRLPIRMCMAMDCSDAFDASGNLKMDN